MGIINKLFGKRKKDIPQEDTKTPEPAPASKKIYTTEEYKYSQGIYDRNLKAVYTFELQPITQDTDNSQNNQDEQSDISSCDLVLGEYLEITEGILTLTVTAKRCCEAIFACGNTLMLSYSKHGESFFIKSEVIESSVAVINEADILKEFGIDPADIGTANKEEQHDDEHTPAKYIVQIILCGESRRHHRKHGRISIEWKVYYKEGDTQVVNDEDVESRDLSGYLTTQTIDISEGGFKSTVDRFIEKDTVINCVIEVDADNVSRGELIGKVIRCYQLRCEFEIFEMTVQFIAMSGEVRKFLGGWIEKMQPAAVNAEARISISDNNLDASIELLPPENNGADITYEDLCARLESENIKHGIDYDLLKSISDKQHYNLEYVIAKATLPVHGEDAELTYHVDMNPSFTPKIGEDGVADFKDLGMIHPVSRHEVLAEKKHLTTGQHGTDITGAVIEAIPGKDYKLPLGKNTVINEADTALTAATDGYVSIVDGKINVFDTYIVNGDVEYTTGNIDHNGIVVVKGDVRSGFSVTATGDVVVHGTIEAASVTAGGTLVVHGGCVGEENNVDVKGNVAIKFIDGGLFRIKGSLTTSYILSARVMCGDIVEMVRPGLIRNSHVTAKISIKAISIGGVHSGADRTIVEVGNDPATLGAYYELTKDLEKLDRDLETVRTNIQTLTLQKHKQELSNDKLKMLDSFKLLIKQLSRQRDDALEMYRELKERIDMLGYGTITVEEVAYEGLKVIIGPREYVLRDTVKAAIFCRTNEGVVIDGL